MASSLIPIVLDDIQREYWHEVESFAAILAWIVFRLDDGRQQQGVESVLEWGDCAITEGSYLLQETRQITYGDIRSGYIQYPKGTPDHVMVLVRKLIDSVLTHCFEISEAHFYLRSVDPPPSEIVYSYRSWPVPKEVIAKARQNFAVLKDMRCLRLILAWEPFQPAVSARVGQIANALRRLILGEVGSEQVDPPIVAQ